MQPRKPLHFVNTIVVLVGKRQSTDPQCEEVLPSACADIVAADPSVCAKDCTKSVRWHAATAVSIISSGTHLCIRKLLLLRLKCISQFITNHICLNKHKKYFYKENDIHVTFLMILFCIKKIP